VTCIGFVPDLYDLGGQHVCWDTDQQCPVQDPTTGGTNAYCSGFDVFMNAAGDTYYRVSIPDGAVYAVNSVTPPSQQGSQAPGSQQPISRPGSPSTNNPQQPIQIIVGSGAPVSSAAPGSQQGPRATNQAGASTGAAVASGLGNIGQVLGTPFGTGGFRLPLWAWLGGGFVLVNAMQRRRGRGAF